MIKAADGTVMATFFDQNRVVVPLSEISPLLQHAVIATEDKRFYEHAGVDPKGMLRAFVKGQTTSGPQQGASTLTQQYIKNVLIADALTKDTKAEQLAAINAARESDGAEGIARKLREAKLAISLEKTQTKDQILEKYLNIAQFGASVYGAESAAQYYFSKSAKDLNYLEAATIAGITQSPSRWDPVLNPDSTGAAGPPQHGAHADVGAEVHHPGGVRRRHRDAARGDPRPPAAEAGLHDLG